MGRAGIHPRTACLRAAPPVGEHSSHQTWYRTAEASWRSPCPLGMCGLESAAGSCSAGDRALEVRDEHGLQGPRRGSESSRGEAGDEEKGVPRWEQRTC